MVRTSANDLRLESTLNQADEAVEQTILVTECHQTCSGVRNRCYCRTNSSSPRELVRACLKQDQRSNEDLKGVCLRVGCKECSGENLDGALSQWCRTSEQDKGRIYSRLTLFTLALMNDGE